jgi:hypothetical protein
MGEGTLNLLLQGGKEDWDKKLYSARKTAKKKIKVQSSILPRINAANQYFCKN